MELKLLAVSTEIQNPALPSPLNSTNGDRYFSGLLSTGVGIALMIGGIIFVFMLVMGAIEWISSGGDKGKTESARTKVTNAVIGLIILLAVITVVKLVEIIMGVNILSINLIPLQI